MKNVRAGRSNRACSRFPLDARPKNKNRSFGNAHVTSGRTKNAREREGTDARSGTNGRWKLDTRFISWSDCDFRRGFKYWKYRAVAFNLPRDPIEFYKRGKSANITRWRPPRGLQLRRWCRRALILEISLLKERYSLPLLDGDKSKNSFPRRGKASCA